MHKVTCGTCNKSFNSKWEDADECYDCALERFSGGGGAPEEGDFNSARIASGELPNIQYEAVEDDSDPYWIQMLDDGVEDEGEEVDSFDFAVDDEDEGFAMPEPLDPTEFYTD